MLRHGPTRSPILLLLALCCFAAAGWLAWRSPTDPAPLAALSAGDQAFLNQRYHAALLSYREQVAQTPDQSLPLGRLGMLYTLRREVEPAQIAFAQALYRGLTGEDLALIRLYMGALASQDTTQGQPLAEWQQIPPGSALLGPAMILQAEWQLRQSAFAEAEQLLRQALDQPLTSRWAFVAHVRLALLRATSDPTLALAELDLAQQARAGLTDTPAAIGFADPLLPPLAVVAERLRAILQTSGDQRTQLLGQLFLDADLLPLAEAQFAQIPPTSDLAINAAAYLAYTRWRAGDRVAGLEALRRLVEQHPNEATARALFALAAIGTNDPTLARQQLNILLQLAPGDPATYLAIAEWRTNQRDYVAAADAYRNALSRASIDQRTRYAIASARFHLETSWEVCAAGLSDAELAANPPAPEQPTLEALTLLAQARLACQNAEGARSAAARAATLDPNSPIAYLQLGRALAATGDRSGARAALIHAADRGIGTEWQRRAEDQLRSLGL
ncbi:MAG: tetratricopeptide repeat protein [Roseiflexaceae bacterium]